MSKNTIPVLGIRYNQLSQHFKITSVMGLKGEVLVVTTPVGNFYSLSNKGVIISLERNGDLVTKMERFLLLLKECNIDTHLLDYDPESEELSGWIDAMAIKLSDLPPTFHFTDNEEGTVDIHTPWRSVIQSMSKREFIAPPIAFSASIKQLIDTPTTPLRRGKYNPVLDEFIDEDVVAQPQPPTTNPSESHRVIAIEQSDLPSTFVCKTVDFGSLLSPPTQIFIMQFPHGHVSLALVAGETVVLTEDNEVIKMLDEHKVKRTLGWLDNKTNVFTPDPVKVDISQLFSTSEIARVMNKLPGYLDTRLGKAIGARFEVAPTSQDNPTCLHVYIATVLNDPDIGFEGVLMMAVYRRYHEGENTPLKMEVGYSISGISREEYYQLMAMCHAYRNDLTMLVKELKRFTNPGGDCGTPE